MFYDPFSPQVKAGGVSEEEALLRLVGVLRDRARELALLETADGAMTVEPGQRLGDDRVTGMDTFSITLTNPVGTRTLTMPEAS
jgi:Tfp pilus assembly protein PilP